MTLHHSPRRSGVSRRLLLACALATTGLAAQADVLADVQKARSIKIAIPTDFVPYGFVGADLQPQGLDVDIAKYVAAKMGVKVELVPVTVSNRIPYLQTGKAHLVVSALGKNPDREKVIDFSSAYAPFYIGVFGPKTIAIKSPADLAGKTVAVTRGTTDDVELTKVAPAGVEIRRFEGNDATIAAYVSGQTQLLATGQPAAEAVASRAPVEIKFPLRMSPCYIGLPKGEDALRTKVNEILAEGRKNGDLDKLSRKWLHQPMGDMPL
ncbi:transporter substrate-binding domain-containing protein [Xylophilus sp. GW821-FHT01B05]